MSGGLLPPFGEPPGERVGDAVVLHAFVRSEPSPGHSETFHVEGAVLVAARDVATAMRIGPRSFLVRLDLPEGLQSAKRSVEQVLAAEGMGVLDNETLLAAPVAVQVLGLRLSTWDLWGADIDEAFTDLRAAAAGEWEDFFPEGPPPLGPPP